MHNTVFSTEERKVERGDIWSILPADMDDSKARYGIIVGNNKGNTYSPIVEVAYLREDDGECLLPGEASLCAVSLVIGGKTYVVDCCEVETVSKGRLDQYIGLVEEQKMPSVDRALKISLGLDNNIRVQALKRSCESAFASRYGKPVLKGQNPVYRGEIYYVEPDLRSGSEQKSVRPAVIVSDDLRNRYAPDVEIIYLTTREKKPMPTHVSIKTSRLPSTALAEQIFTVKKDRLGSFINQVSMRESEEIDKALKVCLNLGDNGRGHYLYEEWEKENISRMNKKEDRSLGQNAEQVESDVQKGEEAALISASETKPPVQAAESVSASATAPAAPAQDAAPADAVPAADSGIAAAAQTQASNPVSAPIQAATPAPTPVPTPAPMPVVSAVPVEPKPFDIHTVPEYIRVVAERDIYKKMYYELLANATGVEKAG